MFGKEPGQKVVLRNLPAGLLDGLPDEDQKAICSIIGKEITLAGYSYGQAELEFLDDSGDSHTIWVSEAFINGSDNQITPATIGHAK